MTRPILKSVFAHGGRVETIAQSCIDQLDGLISGPGLGLVYMSRGFEPMADDILARLGNATGIKDWVGSSADRVIGGGKLLPGEAVSVMILPYAPHDYRLFDEVPSKLEGFGLLHATLERDVQCGIDPKLQECGTNSVGSQVLDGIHLCNALISGGFSGVCLNKTVPVSTIINRALKPAGPKRAITSAYENVIAGIEGSDPLAAMASDAGELLIRNEANLKEHILVALTDSQAEKQNKRVEIAAIAGIDPATKRLQLDRPIRASHIQFARRDPVHGLDHLTKSLCDAATKIDNIAAVIYFMSSRRGEKLFGAGTDELSAIRSIAGSAPVIGLVCDREIFGSRDEFCSSVITMLGSGGDHDRP